MSLLGALFGSSRNSTSSASTSNTTTNNIDQRVAVASGGIGASASGGGTVNISALDGGAISQAFGFGRAALSESVGVTNTALNAVKDAYSEARGESGKLVQVMLIAGVMVVGVVAIGALKK